MDSKANMKNYSRGDVVAGFEALNNIIDKNDGQRNFSIQDNSCFDSDVPFGAGTQTHLKITNNNHDINQLGESFITAKVKLTGHFGKTYSATTTESSPTAPKPNCLKFFIGFKNAAEIVRQLEVENNNVDTDYLQTDCIRESFAFHTYRSKSSKTFVSSHIHYIQTFINMIILYAVLMSTQQLSQPELIKILSLRLHLTLTIY